MRLGRRPRMGLRPVRSSPSSALVCRRSDYRTGQSALAGARLRDGAAGGRLLPLIFVLRGRLTSNCLTIRRPGSSAWW